MAKRTNLPSDGDLKKFLDKATKATYAGDGKEEKKPERKGFTELVYKERNFEYRDSYTGHYRSHGTEVVRYKGEVIRATSYRGGMVKGKEKLASRTFSFLKKALSEKTKTWSARGPASLKKGDWLYVYRQGGGFEEISGYEEIFYKGELVFYHKVIGGIVKNK